MNKYEVRYLDSKYGDTVMRWEGYAEDASDALDEAMRNDYYFGRYLSTELLEENTTQEQEDE